MLAEACWGLAYLSDDADSQQHKIQSVLDCGIAARLVELLSHHSADVQTPALRTVHNLLMGDEAQVQVLLDCGLLLCLPALLVHPKTAIRTRACHAVCCVTAGGEAHIELVIAANILSPLVSILQEDDLDMRTGAVQAISNATACGSAEQCRSLVQWGVLPPLCALLACPDSEIIQAALEGVENILRVGKADGERQGGHDNQYAIMAGLCDGLHHLESLQSHDEQKIWLHARSILSTYFTAPEDSS